MNLKVYLVFVLTFISFCSFSQSLQDGKLIWKDSTIASVKIFRNYKPENGSRVNKFDFIKVFTNDTVKELQPENCRGFVIGKKVYKTLEIRMPQSTAYLFCEVLEEGHASLYYYGGNAFGQKEIYIFKKPENHSILSVLKKNLRPELRKVDLCLSIWLLIQRSIK